MRDKSDWHYSTGFKNIEYGNFVSRLHLARIPAIAVVKISANLTKRNRKNFYKKDVSAKGE